MKVKTKILSAILFVCMLVAAIPAVPFTASTSSADATAKEDAMTAIIGDTSLNGYKQGDTQTMESDGYIGIPVEITVYYDYAGHGAAKPGYNGTAVILYVVNSGAERVGTDSDVSIISSMLDRGYAVAVCDYKNDAKAVSPALEYSAQALRAKLKNGSFFTDKTVFPGGSYYENHVVPAGHDISLGHVFYEIDKHGTDGVLERIVHVWNEDFRGVKRNVIIKWVDENGNRKATQNGFDGSTPEWYSDAAGKTVDNENGEYIKVHYTKALTITDCVQKDGAPLDFNLYMHVIYPTNPEGDVPVMTLSSSAEHLASGMATETRPYLVGYSMQGYAISSFDFEYIPMARADHYGYFSGDESTGISGQNGTFGLGAYNRSNYQTAAMRYLRYLSLTDHETFSFNVDKLGIYGNSKGGSQTFLGAAALRESASLADLGSNAAKEDLEEYVDNKVTHFYNDAYITATDPLTGQSLGFNGNSRYQNGNTEDVTSGSYTVDGGELQPWLTYTDENGDLREIPSGVQWVYSSCGGTSAHEWTDHSPAFTASNMYDSFGSGYSTHNYIENCFRIYDVPSLFFEVPLPHDLVSGKDVNYGVDTYLAMFKASHYYLKDTPVSVVYTTPADCSAGVKTTDGITIRFYGPVPQEEIERVVIRDSNGNEAEGTWESAYGKTQWTLHPNALNGGVKYSVIIPSSLKGDNGKEIGAEYTFTFFTNGEKAEVKDVNATVTEASGTYFSFTAPSLDEGCDRIKLRFKVSGDAANVASIYAAASETDTSGKLLGSVNIKGAGYYEYDVSEYVIGKEVGSTVYFLVKTEKAAESTLTYKHDFDSTANLSTNYTSSETVTEVSGESVTALKMINTNYRGINPTVLTASKAINGGNALTKADYGRRFTVKLRVYDTASRFMQIWFNDCTNRGKQVGDYSYTRAVIKTEPGQWTEITVPYVVYEMDYGIESVVKQIKLIAFSTGSDEMPYYIDSLTVTEHTTDIEITETSLVCAAEGGITCKAPSSETMSWEVNGTQYATWWEAVQGTVNGTDGTLATATIKLLRDYEFDSSMHAGDGNAVSVRNALTIDLNGYRVTLEDSSLITVESNNTDTLSYTVKNGAVVISGEAVVKCKSADAAGDGKISNVSFQNVFFTVADGSTCSEVFTSSTDPDGASVTRNFTFYDCTVNIDRTNLPKPPITFFPIGTENVTNNYVFTGGSINVTSLIKLSISDAFHKFTFTANGEGEYTAIKVSECVQIDEKNYLNTDNGFKLLALESTEDHVSTYGLADPKYNTEYGVIPDKYAPDEYPFAIFIDGEFVGACTTFFNKKSDTDTTNVLGNLWQESHMRGESDKCAYVVLRRDYDMSANPLELGFDNLGQLGGNITFDLCGNRLTTTAKSPLLPMTAKYGVDTPNGYTHVYPLSIRFLNGTIDSTNSTLITYQSMNCTTDTQRERYDEAKLTDISFEDIELILGNKPIVTTADTANLDYGARTTLNFKDCEIDLSANTAAMTLFDGSDTSNMNVLAVSFEGGNVTATDLDNITFSTIDPADSITFLKTDGAYTTTLTVPSSYTLPTISGMGEGDEGVKFGGAGTVSGDNTVYGLVSFGVSTKYGIIPDEYSDADKYPFAVFKDGLFINACTNYCLSQDKDLRTVLGSMLTYLRGEYTGVQYQVLMLRDYDMTADSISETSFDNLSQIGGEWVLDLNSHTLTLEAGYTMFRMEGKYGYDDLTSTRHVYSTSIVVKNGTVVTGAPLVFAQSYSFTSNASRYDKTKIANITYENVNVKVPASAVEKGANVILNSGEKANTDHGMELYLTFNNCYFDIASDSSVTLFKEGYSTMNDAFVAVNGGSISVSNLSNLTLSDLDGEDSLTIGKGDDGVYTYITATEGAAPSDVFTTTEYGDLHYGKIDANTYKLGISTQYGHLPCDYMDEDKYPFIVFMDGLVVGAHSVWSQDNKESALWEARKLLMSNLGAGKSAQILMRRDYTMGSGDMNYGNLAHFNGTLIIDLCDFTFTTASGKSFLHAKAQTIGKDGVVDTTIIVKGGNIVSIGASAITAYTSVISNREEYYTRAKIFDITFDGTRFTVPKSGLSPIAILDTCSNDTGAVFNLVLNNCVIDVQRTGEFVMINGADSTGNNILNLTVNGGNISVSDCTELSFFNVDAGDTVKFGSYSNSYTSFTISNGIPVDAYFKTVDGSDAYLKSTETASTYIVTPCLHLYDGALDGDCNICGKTRQIVDPGFVVKVNLTLTSEISLNFYTPVGGNVTDISVDGVALVSEGTVVMDGVTYEVYRFLGIAPSKAMEGHTVAITYLEDGNTLTREVEYSALNYAKSVLTNATISEAGKAIVRDMLGFAKAAYDYFGNEDATAEEVELLATLTSQYPATAVESIPTVDGVDPSGIASVVESAQLSLGNGVIKMVLNIADTSKPLTVTADGVTVISLGENHGKAQVTVELRAYQLGEVLTIASGEQSGTYCFYEYARAMMGEDGKLDALLLAMHAYSVSAKSYRAESN